MEISSKEVMRYLGYKEGRILPRTTTNESEEIKEIDERVLSHIDELINEFSANIVPKSTYLVFNCKIEETSLTIGKLSVNSKNLAGHLAGCNHAVMFAATLGAQADTMIRRLSVQDMEKALIAQAVCAAMLEAYCDSVTCLIAKLPELYLLYPLSRFSPGYGDFDIAYQKDFLNILNCSRIGLTLTDGYMLAPSKSVTALIGFSPEKNHIEKKCGALRCASCADTQCKLREAV